MPPRINFYTACEYGRFRSDHESVRVEIADLPDAINALVGGTLGQERTVVPLLAEQTFHLAAFSSALTFILAFGAVKAVTNFFAGTLSDRFGRKPVLVAGWLAALLIPPLLIFAPDWGWVVAANVLLGVNQGLTWHGIHLLCVGLG
jgi:MFS family permease